MIRVTGYGLRVAGCGGMDKIGNQGVIKNGGDRIRTG